MATKKKKKVKAKHKPSDDYALYDLGGKIKAILNKKGITQADFAKRCDLTEATASNILRNKRQPNFATVAKITEGLLIKFEDLIK